MANRSGPMDQVRSPATYAAIDTWYQVDADTVLGANASSLRLYVTAGIASPGLVDFYIQHSPGGDVWYDYCIEGTSPHAWGSLVFTAPGRKSIELTNLNLFPNEKIRLFFRCSEGAASATIGINSMAWESGNSASPQRVTIYSPIESNGAMPVNVQDQTSPPVDAFFAREISPFTLAADTPISTVTTLEYDIVASPGHGIIVTDEILLLDTAGDRSFQAKVTVVVGDTLTVDSPLDHLFPASSTLGRLISTNMNVDGSVTPVIYTMRAGANERDHTRFIVAITDDAAMDDARFGGLPALTNGFVFRIYNSFQRTIFNFKSNGEISNACFDIRYASRAPAGEFGFSARITFGGQSKHGIVLRLGTGDVLQWIVQDDLTDLSTLKVMGQGHEVTD